MIEPRYASFSTFIYREASGLLEMRTKEGHCPISLCNAGNLEVEMHSVGSFELCRKLGDEVDQAAWLAGNTMTSMPFWNLMPWTIFGNWFSPFNRRHVFGAALTSLNTMSLAVLADSAPLVRMVR